IAELPKLTDGFEIIVGLASVDSSVNTTINVSIQIIEKGSSNTETVTFQIIGFKIPSVIVTIDEQTAVFEDAKTTYHPSFDPIEVVDQINGAASPEAKLTFLRTFVNVPTIHDNFGLEVLSAIIREGTNNVIDVSIKIFEIDNINNFKNVTLKVEGFVLEDIQAELAEEIAKFTTPTPTKSTIDSISKVVDKINGLNPNERIHALSLLANMPSLSEGFVLRVDSASIGQDAKTTLNVMITISSTKDTSISKNITYSIFGFKTTDLETEANKFNDLIINASHSNNLSALEVVKQIEAATDTPQKLIILNNITDSNIPILHDDYEFSILWAIMENNTSISVTVSVNEKSGNHGARIVIFHINNLKVSTIDIEAAKFASSTTITPVTSAIDAAKSINQALGDAAKLNALGIFANVPTLAQGFEFKVKSAKVNGSIETSVDVVISIMETGKPQTTRDIVYLVTGLKNSTVIIEAAKFNNPITTSKPNSNVADLVTNINNASDVEKVNIIKGFANLPSLAYGFE
ncbi:MAG: hypothetical protein ACRCXE_03540, partial [Metamycoplasmataceae bacterium]